MPDPVVLIGKKPVVAADPTAGMGLSLGADGRLPLQIQRTLPGYEIAVATGSSVVALGTTATDVISAGSVIYDGSPVWVDFFAQSMQFTTGSAVGDNAQLRVLVDGTDVSGTLYLVQCLVAAATTVNYFPIRLGFRYTPAAGVHTIKISGAKSNAAATVQIVAGAGGAGTNGPMALRITKAT
jgi:hypothetical protein